MPKHNHTASMVKEVLVHALFWIVVTLRFLNTSFLRPQNSLSIELTCLIILIGLVYVNMLVWVPQLWKKDKKETSDKNETYVKPIDKIEYKEHEKKSKTSQDRDDGRDM